MLNTTENLLTRGVVEAIDPKHLATRLGRNRPLRVKLGIDATGFQLHLGHVVPLRKLKAFQEAGHTAVFIIGDFTAHIGDPSGRDKSRSSLTLEQTRRFAATYLEQASRIIDIKKTEVHYNSEWFEKFTATDLLKLFSHLTINQLMAHETFRKRISGGQPLGFHELSYPLLQGYDSVAVRADVELGASEQKFNLLAGRDIQQAYGQEPQDIVLLEYLVGTDGKEKMSKSLGNYIAIEDDAKNMYGKTMSIPDKQILHYFELATDLPAEDIATYKKELRQKEITPRDLKAELAKTLVRMYHGDKQATEAEFEFTHVFRKKGAPSDMPEIEVAAGEHSILNLLVSNQLATSRSDARRLVEQGGVKIDQRPITDWEKPIAAINGAILQVGKRRFVKIKVRP
jgi:tyrosyl-tRNA synthetase